MTVQELIKELEKMPQEYRNCECVIAYDKPLSKPDKYGRMITEIHKNILFVNCVWGINGKLGPDAGISIIKVEKDA